MSARLTERRGCRVCGRPLQTLLNFGTPAVPAYVAPHEPDPERLPLELVVCQGCELVQLRHTVDRDQLYRRYWYQSGINESMIAELRDVVTCAVACVGPFGPKETVLDVGANDGTLLRVLTERMAGAPPQRIAVEPAYTFTDRLSQIADVVVADYFPSRSTTALADRSVKILTSIAMFYDLDDPLAFVREVDRLLARDGVWIVQMQDLAQMVRATAYDNVCFEHLAYYSTETFTQLLMWTDLEIRRVEPRRINGGSLRYYITRRQGGVSPDVRGRALEEQRASESWLTRDRLQRFARDVDQQKDELLAVLRSCPTVDLYAASTKSSTLLQYCGIDRALIRRAVERSPEKVGRVTSGTRIPIISEEEWRADPAPVTLLGAWGFRDVVLQREAAYLERGGAFIIPLPEVELVQCGRSSLPVAV